MPAETGPSYDHVMRRASRTAAGSTKPARTPAKPPALTREFVERIRERREQIKQRLGILSDSTALIRADRDR